MIFASTVMMIVFICFMPTLVSFTRNGWNTNCIIGLLNIMLVLVSFTVLWSSSVLDMTTNTLMFLSYFILLSFIPNENDPELLTNKIKGV